MLIKSSLLLIGLLALSGPPIKVILSGTSQDCFAGSPDLVSGVAVSAFQVSKAGNLIALLKTMDQATFVDGDYAAMSRFDTQYSQMVSLVNSTRALARGTSGSNGAFALTFTAVDSVLVVGYEAVEDEPYYYSYKTMPGRSNLSFVLDMSRGKCAN